MHGPHRGLLGIYYFIWEPFDDLKRAGWPAPVAVRVKASVLKVVDVAGSVAFRAIDFQL